MIERVYSSYRKKKLKKTQVALETVWSPKRSPKICFRRESSCYSSQPRFSPTLSLGFPLSSSLSSRVVCSSLSQFFSHSLLPSVSDPSSSLCGRSDDMFGYPGGFTSSSWQPSRRGLVWKRPATSASLRGGHIYTPDPSGGLDAVRPLTQQPDPTPLT